MLVVLEFWDVGFSGRFISVSVCTRRIKVCCCVVCWKEENRRTQRKTLRARWEPTTNSTYMWQGAGVEPGTHFWEASALTTASSLLLQRKNLVILIYLVEWSFTSRMCNTFVIFYRSVWSIVNVQEGDIKGWQHTEEHWERICAAFHCDRWERVLVSRRKQEKS